VAIKPDVLIAGAGPAVSIAGYLLAGPGFRVLLLEKSEFPRYRIGESLTPQHPKSWVNLPLYDRRPTKSR
jgi:flavin-dependent dehydrogenase